MKIMDYPKVQGLMKRDTLFLDKGNTTSGILADDMGKSLSKLLTGKEAISNYPLSDLDDVSEYIISDTILVGTSSGNKQIKIFDLVYGIFDPPIGSISRKILWRGKNLGSKVTAEQYAQIKTGAFKGMFLGDYWEIDGRIWRIVDFNYWLNSGDTPCEFHHLVIMPDHYLYTKPMNFSDTTAGAYVESNLYMVGLKESKAIITDTFGSDHILDLREYYQNAVSNGYSSAGTWINASYIIPNEPMIYGSYIFTPSGDGTFIPNKYTIDKTQLAAMREVPALINPHGEGYWLRDVVSSTDFAFVHPRGHASHAPASTEWGVRPVFGLIG